MPSVTFFKFRFTPSWPMVLLTALFCALFLRLGFWQVQRANEKTKMIEVQKERVSQAPELWTPMQKIPLQYEHVKLQGHYLDTIFLLDNQHHQHQFGYDALSPLELSDGSVILVDRGWIPGDISRRTFPQVQTPDGIVQLQGMVYFPSKKQWVLGQAIEEKGNKTFILERFDKKLVNQLLQKSVYPFIIRLDKQDTHGFVREWETVSMPPQRHLAYAIQWFAMALVILIIFIALNLKKKT